MIVAKKRPTFIEPPLAEVVCGFQFRPMQDFQVPYFGLFWQGIRKDFPRVQTMAPLVGGSQGEDVQITLTTVPDPRVWFISEDDSLLLQLQSDRFYLNWREGSSKARYPRFTTVLKIFKQQFMRFEKFLKAEKLNPPQLVAAELSYVNRIRKGDGWEDLIEIGKLFPEIAWRDGRQMSPPTSLVLRSAHQLEIGSLATAIRSARDTTTKEPIIRFDLTARTNLVSSETIDHWDWFGLANKAIVEAFIDMTSEYAQKKVWGRTQ